MARIVSEQSDDDELPELDALLETWKRDRCLRKAGPAADDDHNISHDQVVASTAKPASRTPRGIDEGKLKSKSSSPMKKTARSGMKTKALCREKGEGDDEEEGGEKEKNEKKNETFVVRKKVVLSGARRGEKGDNPLLMPLSGVSGNVVRERGGKRRISPIKRGLKSQASEGEGWVVKDGKVVVDALDSEKEEGEEVKVRKVSEEKRGPGDVPRGRGASLKDLGDEDQGRPLKSVDILDVEQEEEELKPQRIKKTPARGVLLQAKCKPNREAAGLEIEDGSERGAVVEERLARVPRKTSPDSSTQLTLGVRYESHLTGEDCSKDESTDSERNAGKKSSYLEVSEPRLKKYETGDDYCENEIMAKLTTPTKPAPRYSIRNSRKLRFEHHETDEECSDIESDGISDFVVNDSYVSAEEDTISATPPPPMRSPRKLIRGRKPRSFESSEDEADEKSTRTTEKRKISSGLRLEKEEDSVKISDTDNFLSSSNDLKRSRTHKPKNESRGEDLGLDLMGLSLNDPSSSKIQNAKRCMEQKFTTPPRSPLLKSVKLKSPIKKFPTIPTSPHRPTMDSFWDQEAINDWNDEYSPQKVLRPLQLDDSPVKGGLLFSPKKSPIKPDKAAKVAKVAKKAFEESKHAMAEDFLAKLDEVITQGQIFKLAASTGGVRIIWSNKLNTTAGRANWKREIVKTSSGNPPETTIIHRHHATIELASKVISTEHRLLNVLAHEFCHLANFMISNVKTNPHGKEFKAWAAKCSSAFVDRGIEVTTKHTYEIEYKYVWECENCGLEFKRHSKSIDPGKHRCGSCKAVLVQTKPVPRGCGKAEGAVKKVSEYQMFVKENMGRVREENPGSPQKEVLGLVAKRYKEFKASKLVLTEEGSLSGRTSKEVTPEVIDVKSLVRRLDFLDLTSP